MSFKMKFFGTVVDGVLKLRDKVLYQKEIKAFDGKEVEIDIYEAGEVKTSRQNRYLWSVVYRYAKFGFLEAGNEGVSEDDVHEYFKDLFLKDIGKDMFVKKSSEVRRVTKSTKAISKQEMRDYIEKIARFCAEYFGIDIPMPDENWNVTTSKQL
jgi:hypothetical protein